MKAKLSLLILSLLLFANFSAIAQQDYWTKIESSSLHKNELIKRSITPQDHLLYELDLEILKNKLIKAPSTENSAAKKSKLILEFPTSNGSFEKFSVIKSSIMEEELQKKYPEIQTYKAVGIDDPTATMRFSVTQFGLHTMSLSAKRNVEYIDPYTENRKNYIVYNRDNIGEVTRNFDCYVDEIENETTADDKQNITFSDADDSELRTYRLAQSCNAEYGNLFATPGNEIAAIQAQMAITINRVNEIYERDLAIRLVFIANNDALIYYGNPNSDPWNWEFNSTTQQVIDNTIGSSNYDIGHNFNTSGGGSAGCIGCVCISGQKGSGFTGSPNPVGDAFYIDYVAHEMGHQFGGLHTMNTCSRSGDGTTEVEPASGSSIMGYAGICSVNVQSNSDAHFNYVNIRDILNNVKNGVSSICAQETSIQNQAPTADAGNDYTIPKSTAFVLGGSATDPDGLSTLTYNWSQNDPEVSPGFGSPSPNYTQGPMYRAILPLESPKRYLPNLTSVLNGNLTPTWEVTPSVGRELNFSFVVRDNGSGYAEGIGQTASDLMKVTVDGNSGPFTVTSQNQNNNVWFHGQSKNVTWNVANTNNSPVNAANVDIFMNSGSGSDFDILVASNLPNNGSATITVPNEIDNNQARVMVKASNNIFYAVNSANFTATYPFTINTTNDVAEICNETSIDIPFNYNTNNNFNETVNFTINNLPSGLTATFTPNSVSADNTSVNLSITGTSSLAIGSYDFTIVGTSASNATAEKTITLEKYDNTIAAPDLITPADNDNATNLYPVLTWQELSNTSFYTIQIAEDPNFTTIIVDEDVTDNNYNFITAVQEETYYWRVKAVNFCTESTFSSAYSFTIDECGLCESNGNLASNVSNTLVDFNSINNSTSTTKTSGYSDFTNLSTNLAKESSYALTVNVFTDGDNLTTTTVWIDWNQDCVFSSDEMYNLGTNQNQNNVPSSISPLSITVPQSALLGETRMRVSTKVTSAANACEKDFDGEVEDYTVIVTDELSTSSNELADSFAIYPNPNQGEFTVSLRSENPSPIDINVFDITGRRIFTQSYEYQHDFSQNLRLNQAQAGVYFVKVSNGNNNVTKKVIVE